MSILDYTFIKKQEIENLYRKIDILKDKLEDYKMWHLEHRTVTPALKKDEAEEEIASLKQEVEEYKRKWMEEVNKRVEMAQLFDKQEKLMKGISWNSVANVLPEENTPVLVTYISATDGEYTSDQIAVFKDGEWYWYDDAVEDNDERVLVKITHWMPLPKPPRE